jgi:hypothetical protein
MDVEKFQGDVNTVTEQLSSNLEKNSSNLEKKDWPKLNFVRDQLIEMYKKNLVKINHSVLELICAANLIANGYAVNVEKHVSESQKFWYVIFLQKKVMGIL